MYVSHLSRHFHSCSIRMISLYSLDILRWRYKTITQLDRNYANNCTFWLQYWTRSSDYITAFTYKSHSSINHILLKDYLRGSSPNKLQNSCLCLVLLIMYIIKRTSCFKQKNLLTAFCKSTIHKYQNYLPWHRDTSSHKHCTSMLNSTSNIISKCRCLSAETDSRSLTQDIPCRKVNWCLPYCTFLPPDQSRNQFNSSPHLQFKCTTLCASKFWGQSLLCRASG